MATYVERPTVPPGIYATAIRPTPNAGALNGLQSEHLQEWVWSILKRWAALDWDLANAAADYQYEPMPPIEKYTFSVDFRIRGLGVPMPYELDDLAE